MPTEIKTTRKNHCSGGPLRVAALVTLAGLALAGCRAEEQGRVINFKPGVYLGKADTGLSDQTREQLMARARLQSEKSPLAGGASPQRGDVRQPAAASVIDRNALQLRLKRQDN